MVLQAILDRDALCPTLTRRAASSSRGPLLGPRVHMASLRLLIPHLPAYAPAIFAWCAAHPRGADAAPAATMPVLGPHQGPSPLLPAQPSQLAGGSDLCLLHYARTAPREPHHASSSREGSPPSPGPSRIEPAGRGTFTLQQNLQIVKVAMFRITGAARIRAWRDCPQGNRHQRHDWVADELAHLSDGHHSSRHCSPSLGWHCR